MVAPLPSTAPTRPRVALRAAQLAWLVVVLPAVLIYFGILAIYLQNPGGVCDDLGPDCTEAAVTAVLADFGLTPAIAQAISIGFTVVGAPVGCILIAAFIFWRRPDRPITLALSAMLALYGPVVQTPLVDIGLADLGLNALARLYHLIFEALFYYVLLTFPNGRFAPRWSWLFMAAALGLSLAFPSETSGLPTLLVISVIGLVLQVYRYQRVSSLTERQQAKWAVVGLLAFLLNFVLYLVVVKPAEEAGLAGLPVQLVFVPINFLLVLSLPVTLLIASLRYRLWDIDVIIRRTLVYAVLSATLALVYFAAVIVLQTLTQALTGQAQSALVTVLSTLAIAALFGPLRRRVQSAIDRRFYRRTYDAAHTLAAFGATVRDELELDRVAAQLVQTADVTLQPATASLWLKPPAPDQRT